MAALPVENHGSPVMELLNISKSFGATHALQDVSLTLRPGEIHSLLGENGAGKSTLIKIMTGVHQPDRGAIHLDGAPVQMASSADAQRKGVAAIYQEPLLFPDLDVAENIFIGHQDRGPFTRWSTMYEEAAQILASIGVQIDVRAPARGLTLAEQQSIEIAKAISLKVRVLIMDEPTASLSAYESERLFQLMQDLRGRGVSIVFISHRMDEVFRLSDTVTVFRDGRHISSRPRADVTPQSAIAEMVGREMGLLAPRATTAAEGVVLSVDRLGRDGVFEDVSFEIRKGEILGFAGLVGAGRTDVGLALFGIAPAHHGRATLDGRPHAPRSPRQAIDGGIAYVSEDRRQLGLSLPMSSSANISLPVLDRFKGMLGMLSRRKEAEVADEFRRRLHIKTASVEAPVGRMSGGNQQKVLLAKWLNTAPRLLILDEPTRGIDIGAKAEVHQFISELAAQGMAIMLISSDLPEVLSLSDRIVVMREGKQMATLDRKDATEQVVMAHATGQGDQAA
ncbi:sugar ABC transporter ATP-binding protein [Kaistia nematophila]|uniref:Sugar ABC transporter ATP-binding protein n=1 Tax=Kaistia nematophila TaxID=2994654 RepID=A0A9X3IKR4_9HYPH|nr:sugar ABC transporter ATP-binding protein [Kaistia nematophila]